MKLEHLKREDGFTLPEMLVTMMILIVVLFALYSIFDMSLRTFSYGNDKIEAAENARLGMEKMEREIRAAYPYDKGAAAPDTHLFDTWTPTEIKFGNDLDGNRSIECPATTPPACDFRGGRRRYSSCKEAVARGRNHQRLRRKRCRIRLVVCGSSRRG